MDLCKPLVGTGRTVNMDNYFGSIPLAVSLQNNDIYLHCTIQKNRKYLPQYIFFTKQDCNQSDRGTIRWAVNEKYKMVAYGWNDASAVHFVTTADGTDIAHVTRMQAGFTETVRNPRCTSIYNKNMNSVDVFDHVMKMYNLAVAHKWKKYYRSMGMMATTFAI